MKLYATVESERAKKGQGGQYLDIGIQNEYKEVVATINIRAIEGAKGYETRRTIKIWYNGLTEVHAYKNSGDTNETKGEKQKGECLHKNTEWRDEKGKSYLNCFDCGDVLRTK